MLVNWWNILNVKSLGVDARFMNKLQAVVQGPLDEQLNIQFYNLVKWHCKQRVVKESVTMSLPKIQL